MQIKLAVCDDEIKICSHIENILINILSHKFLEYDIDVKDKKRNLYGEQEETIMANEKIVRVENVSLKIKDAIILKNIKLLFSAGGQENECVLRQNYNEAIMHI